MGCAARLGGCLLLLAAWQNSARAADAPDSRESEIVQAPGDAWRERGFRLQLRSGREDLIGFGAVPDGWGVPIAVEPSVRLTPSWSLTSSLQYTLLFAPTLRGLRFAA